MSSAQESNSETRKETARPITPCAANRILIVDDETMIRDLFRRLLSLRLPDCRIDVAINGAEAVEQFHAAHHGVIMMDLRMPVMDGQTAFLEIQKICRDENIEMPAVVFCTGFEPPDTVRTLIAGNPAHCILRKPVTDKILVEALQPRLAAKKKP